MHELRTIETSLPYRGQDLLLDIPADFAPGLAEDAPPRVIIEDTIDFFG